MKKIIITGGSGLLGVNLAFLMKDSWDVHLLYRSNPVSLEGVSSSSLDLGDSKEVEKLFSSINPDLIIHAAGMTSVERCEKYRFEAYESNVLATRNISKIAKSLGTKLVHISTDHFSKSNQEFSTEEDIEIPLNNYARTKFEAEYEVQKHYPEAIIARTNFFGYGHQNRQSFSDHIVTELNKENILNLFTDVFFNPILIDKLYESIMGLVKVNAQGVYNIVGDKRVSKYEFGTELANKMSLNSRLIKESKFTERKDLEIRPLDMSLSNSKLKKILPNLDLSLNSFIDDLVSQGASGRKEVIFTSVKKRKTHNMIHYGKQFIDEQDINSVVRTLNSNFLTQGPKVEEFEQKLARLVDAKYAVAVSNWTCGLHIACLAAGVGPGDSVITSPLSFVASSNCAIFCGATPEFADIDLETLNIDPASVERKCKELGNVKAIIPVHFAGHPCDMKKLKEIADKYGATLIEDSAHALGGSYLTGEKIGSCVYSSMSGFSFHPVKSIATGEGSVITTNDENVYKQLLRLRSHGIVKGDDPFINKEEAYTNDSPNSWYYEMQQLGFNYRITDIQCALGITQLDKLSFFLKRRVEITKIYDNAFKDLEYVKTVQHKTREISGNHLYVILVDFEKIKVNRYDLYNKLKKKNIFGHVHYIPIPMQPYYQENFNIPENDYKNALSYYRQCVTLPLYPAMSDDDIEHVISSFRSVLYE